MGMQTPNKETRLKHYREVLSFYHTVGRRINCNDAMCIKLGDILFDNYMHIDCPVDVIGEFYPELEVQRPRVKAGCHWFAYRDKQSRIKCLEAAIKLCEGVD